MSFRFFPFCDALIKRVEQGVPLEVLDLRMCFPSIGQHDKYKAQLQRFREIVVDVLTESEEAGDHMRSLWKPVPLGIFLDDDAREDSDSDTGSHDEDEE